MVPTQGIITAWKQDKGFGFIRPLGDGPDVFVHIRDFGNIPRVPKIGDSVSYQAMQGKDGRYRAADVLIAGVPRTVPTQRALPRAANKNLGRISPAKPIIILLTIGLLVFGYSKLQPPPIPPPMPKTAKVKHKIVESIFACEGKQFCNEMNSCAEAKYYLNNCPNTEMDGDHDGVPCESQWCN